jgi:hypothetical protein
MRLLILVVIASLSCTAQAAGIGLRAGSTGLGADFGWGIAPTLGGRIGISGGSFNTDVETSDINYDADVKLANLNAFLDWSPLGPFRITAGLIANDNKVDVTGTPRNAAFAGTTVTGTIKPEHSVAPYLGVGYGNVWTAGVNFYFDIGVIFQGTPQVSLNCSPAGSPQCNQVAAEEQRVRDEVSRYKYYPVINLGITIGF